MRYFVNLAGREIEVELTGPDPVVDGVTVRAEMSAVPGSPVRHLRIDGASHTVLVRQGAHKGSWEIRIGGVRFVAEAVDERTRTIREMTGGTQVETVRNVTAPMPGLILRVEVEPGQAVTAGQAVVVVEAMKMENELRAPADGIVVSVAVVAGETVEKGATLIVLE